MTRLFLATLAPMLLALLSVFALSGVVLAQDTRSLNPNDRAVLGELDEGNCLSNREIQAALNDGRIQPLASVLRDAGVSDRPLSVKVCDVGGTPHYVVNVIDSYGESERIVLNAEASY